MKDILIGIDAGTSVIKSVAFTMDGEQLAECSTPNVYAAVSGGGVEQCPNLTWTKTVETLTRLVDEIPDLTQRTAAIAVTGQGDGTWLIDDQGEPVGDAWLWLDARAGELVDEFRASDKDETRFNISGTALAACQQAAQLMWMKRHAPQLIQKSTTAFHCKDWLYLKLTGMRVTDPSEGSFTFGDFRNRQYSSELLDLLDLHDYQHLLPPMLEGTEEHHPLSDNAAKLTGLLSGTPVVLGYVDVVCTGLGAGLYNQHASSGCTIVGSTGIHMRLAQGAAAVALNKHRTGFTIPAPIPDVYIQIQSNMSATLNIDWLLDVAIDLLQSQGVTRSRLQLLHSMDDWITSSKRGDILYQPHISDAGERGPFISTTARAGFTGLNSSHRFPDMMNSVIEGLAFAARDCYEAMGELPEQICLTGGAARSQALRSMFGNTLGATIRTSAREEAGAAGAAMMAALSIGHYNNMQSCAEQWVNPHLSDPEPHNSEQKTLMDSIFEIYKLTQRNLGDSWKQMAINRK